MFELVIRFRVRTTCFLIESNQGEYHDLHAQVLTVYSHSQIETSLLAKQLTTHCLFATSRQFDLKPHPIY